MAYTNTNTQRLYVSEAGNVNNKGGDTDRDLDIEGMGRFTGTYTENDFSVAFTSVNRKENPIGNGWKASLYSGNFETYGDSPQQITNLVGSRHYAKHIGTGECYFIVGSENKAYHEGSGSSGGVYGTNSYSEILGTGSTTQNYVIGVNSRAKIANPNGTVDYLQGVHCTVSVEDGEVTDNVMAMILDLDFTGGDISGDFEYLRIQNDSFASPVGGTARAINSLSVLPSEFGGSIQANNFIDTGVAEYADNAAAIAGGLAVGTHYRTGDLLKVVH